MTISTECRLKYIIEWAFLIGMLWHCCTKPFTYIFIDHVANTHSRNYLKMKMIQQKLFPHLEKIRGNSTIQPKKSIVLQYIAELANHTIWGVTVGCYHCNITDWKKYVKKTNPVLEDVSAPKQEDSWLAGHMLNLQFHKLGARKHQDRAILIRL